MHTQPQSVSTPQRFVNNAHQLHICCAQCQHNSQGTECPLPPGRTRTQMHGHECIRAHVHVHTHAYPHTRSPRPTVHLLLCPTPLVPRRPAVMLNKHVCCRTSSLAPQPLPLRCMWTQRTRASLYQPSSPRLCPATTALSTRSPSVDSLTKQFSRARAVCYHEVRVSFPVIIRCFAG